MTKPNNIEQQLLLSLAANSIRYGLLKGKLISAMPSDYPEAILQHHASFVTLEINHQLRGCIGTLQAHRTLVDDVNENAYSAAFRDPRFPPLSLEEFPLLDIHISILQPAKDMQVTDEADLLSQLRPGIDGLILQEGPHRATFLPSVWESLSTPEQFVSQLKLKAGLHRDYWSKTIHFQSYETFSFAANIREIDIDS
ncbi:MAG: AmmeMemoRadiSam system protein A [Gammaproteobacteria bacterium]|nr:AmmeMemoRadiSam system protein A [Gammaproteobacteria bacterium]